MNKLLTCVRCSIAALALALLSVTCSQPVAAPVPPSADEAPALDLAGRKVTVLTNQPHLRTAEALAKWFHEETGAVVRNVVVDYKSALPYALADVASPQPQLDVIMFWYVDLGALVEHGALVDLTEFIQENAAIIQPDDFVPSLYDPYTLYKGRRWSLPYDGDTHVLFYRQSLLDKYDLIPPETWDDYLAIARTITENERANGVYGAAIMAPPAPLISVSGFVNRLGCYGGRLLDDAGLPVLASDEAVAALTAMVEHCRYALPSPLETDFEVSRDAFLSGKVAMVEQWTDIGVMAEDASQSLIQGDWGVVQMPRGTGDKARHAAALNAGYSLGVSTSALDPEAARAYLLFASRPDVTLRLNLINGGIDPTRSSVLSSVQYCGMAPRLCDAVREALATATPWPTFPEAPKLLDVLSDNVIKALEGRKTPRRALEDAQVQWGTIIASEKSAP